MKKNGYSRLAVMLEMIPYLQDPSKIKDMNKINTRSRYRICRTYNNSYYRSSRFCDNMFEYVNVFYVKYLVFSTFHV